LNRRRIGGVRRHFSPVRCAGGPIGLIIGPDTMPLHNVPQHNVLVSLTTMSLARYGLCERNLPDQKVPPEAIEIDFVI
jgi:hypothetical protein